MNKCKEEYSVRDIRRKLKYGEMTRISNQTWFSQSHVSNVLAGRRRNKVIVEAAYEITKRRK